MNEKRFKLKAPANGIVIPKEIMGEKEIREFLLQSVDADDEMADTWTEKIKKDPIEDLVEMLKQVGYTVETL